MSRGTSPYLKLSPDEALPKACNAFYYSRCKLNYILLADILKRDIIPLLEATSKIKPETAILLLRVFAGLYSDHGKPEQARALYSALDEFLRRFRIRVISSSEYAALLRREAMVMGACGESISEVLARLTDAISTAKSEDTTVSVANTEVWLRFASGDYKGALDILEPLYKKYKDKIFPACTTLHAVSVISWNIAELIHNYALALAIAHPSSFEKQKEHLLEAAKLVFIRSGARLFQLTEDYYKSLILPSLLSHNIVKTIIGPYYRLKLPTDIDNSVIKAVSLIHKAS